MIGARGIEERSMAHVLRRPGALSDRRRSASSRARRALVLSTLIASGWLGASPPRAQDATPSRDATGRPPIGDEFDEPTHRWREGPVRYLLSKDEDKAFRLLKHASREERKLFIDEFWAKRDPDPTTPGNAYRWQDLHPHRPARRGGVEGIGPIDPPGDPVELPQHSRALGIGPQSHPSLHQGPER
jgi:hypothetical protein